MKTIAYVSFLALLLGSAMSRATIIIDDFSTTQVQGPGLFGTGDGSGIIGGERLVQTSIPSIDINSAVPGQLKIVNSSPPNGGKVYFYYDGGLAFPWVYDDNGLGNLDLTQGGINNAFLVDVTSANNHGGTISIADITVPLPLFSGILEIPFANSAGSNFADVGVLIVILDLWPGESYTIDSITVGSITPASSVPESASTACLLFISCGAIILLGRRYAVRNAL